MDEGLRRAAQLGSIDMLYTLIKDNADVFRCIDEMEFVDTPLHIAAAAGHADFAMEMMNLKPSFARKLNKDGFSPIHLALHHQQTEIVLDFLSVDKYLVRVKGREGYTPLHVAARDGNVGLLSQFLDYCPNSILDLTVRKQTALHISAVNNRLEAFRTILQWIQRKPEDDQIQKGKFLNLHDKDGNTILDIAASHNQPQMIKLLMGCEEVDRNKINARGLTTLNVLQRQTQVDCRESLNNILYNPPSRLRRVSSFIKLTYENNYKEMNVATTNALLVVFTLILSMTYQALLSPPGGVLHGDAAADGVGKSVMKPYSFLLFYAANFMAFAIAWSVIISLLKVVAKSIISLGFSLYFLMCICYGVAQPTIAPTKFASWGALIAPSMIFVLLYCIFLFRYKK